MKHSYQLLYKVLRDDFDLLDDLTYAEVRVLNQNFDEDEPVEVEYEFLDTPNYNLCVKFEVAFEWTTEGFLSRTRTINVERVIEYNGSSPYALLMMELSDYANECEEESDDESSNESEDDEEDEE